MLNREGIVTIRLRGNVFGEERYMAIPEELLAYWLDELGPKGWYSGAAELDQDIRGKYLDTWQRVMDGGNSLLFSS